MMVIRRMLICAALPLVFSAALADMSVCAQSLPGADGKKEGPLKIAVTVGGERFTATMADSPAARDFVSLLPLTLALQDYAGTEKVSDLPKRLSTEGAPRGIDPSVGDIAYYAPWGNLALYYNDFGYSNGLVLLGKLDSGVESFKTGGAVKATFEAFKE